MDTKITKDWGYRVVTPTKLNFYHILLPQIGIGFLRRNLSFYKEIVYREDKSVEILTENPLDLPILVSELESLLRNMEAKFAITGDFKYRIFDTDKKFLMDWLLAVEGAIAIIVINQIPKLSLHAYDFELIDSQVGGLYLHPFTILFYESFAKVIQPITVENFLIREEIERTIAMAMKGILQRVGEAQSGYEGMAILSYVEEKTGLDPKLIAKIIYEKTRSIRPPKHSPLFTS